MNKTHLKFTDYQSNTKNSKTVCSCTVFLELWLHLENLYGIQMLQSKSLMIKYKPLHQVQLSSDFITVSEVLIINNLINKLFKTTPWQLQSYLMQISLGLLNISEQSNLRKWKWNTFLFVNCLQYFSHLLKTNAVHFKAHFK